jgi:hypothetical protein
MSQDYKELSIKPSITTYPDRIEVKAGEHVLSLPPDAVLLHEGTRSGSCWYNGIFLVVERQEGRILAYSETGQLLWTIPPQRRGPEWISGFVGVHAFRSKGKTVISFADPIGHVYEITNLETGDFVYLGWTR